MIGFLKGKIARKVGTDTIDVLTDSGVGYEVAVADGMRAFSDWQDQWIAIHEHAPQDAPHELFGFVGYEQRDLFRRLLNIKGVGPKVAMRIVASNELLTTAEGHLVFDSFNAIERLKKLRGVGATLAQRIVEEIR